MSVLNLQDSKEVFFKQIQNMFEKRISFCTIGKNTELYTFIIDQTKNINSPLSAKAYCVINNIKELPKCHCGNIVSWDYRKNQFRISCSPKCDSLIKLKLQSYKKIKYDQKQTENTFQFVCDLNLYNEEYAKSFFMTNCLKKNKNVNGNLTIPRNFIKKFGIDNFNKVLSDWYLNHKSEKLSKYFYDLIYGSVQCKECREISIFYNFKEGYRQFCSSKCSNKNYDRIDKLKDKLLNPSKDILIKRNLNKFNNRINIIIKLCDIIQKENIFQVIATPTKEFYDQDEKFYFRCLACNNEFSSSFGHRRCYSCNPLKYSFEKQVAEEIGYENYILNQKSLLNNKRLQIDIFYPDKKFAIETDGVYFHSFSSKQDEKYNKHQNKALQCYSNMIDFFSFSDLEWKDELKKDIILSMINHKLGITKNKIYARKCVVKKLDKRTTKEFLNENHIQGYCMYSCSFGLFYNNELISIMTFGKSRFDKKIDLELLRFCNKKYYHVIGAASKLFSVFSHDNKGKNIISYCNIKYGNGKLYNNLGFQFKGYSKPNYYWYKKEQLFNRITMQKHKLSKILPNFDCNLTESENLYNNGYRKYFDYGNKIYIKEL